MPPTKHASRNKSSSSEDSSKYGDKYRAPGSEEELTRQNVEAIAKLEEAAHASRTFADRISDWVAAFCGSMTFVWVHVVWFTVWIGCNTLGWFPPFDPFPFTFLTLVVSLEAIFLSTFILISQNVDKRLTDRRNHLDLQINLLAEQENTKMLLLIARIAEKLGVTTDDDPTLGVLEEATRPEKLAEQIEAADLQRERGTKNPSAAEPAASKTDHESES